MRKVPLIWQIYPSLLIVSLVSMLAVTWYAARTIHKSDYARRESNLRATAHLAAEHIRTAAPTLDRGLVDKICKSFGRTTGRRMTFILPSGKVIGDSHKDPAVMDNHADRPEIQAARRDGAGKSIRFSDTMRETMMYVAIPFRGPESGDAVIRCSMSVSDINTAIRNMAARILLAGIAVVLVGAAISVWVSRAINRPLKTLRAGAESFGQGDFSQKLPPSHVLEIDVLSDTMNRMAEHLSQRITTITRQRDEQNALLACMVEAVLAVDTEKQLIRMNRSAAELFHIDPPNGEIRGIEELVRNADLLHIIDRALSSREPVEGEIYLPEDNRYLQANGTILSDRDGQKIGALIVMNDVTNLRKLETVRRDFVANVSHELKTPITSVKGFSETLLEDDPDSRPEDRERFLKIIVKQANRLQSILQDLLILASVEHGTEEDAIELQRTRLAAVIEGAVKTCQAQAREKHIEMEKSFQLDVCADVNIQLMEQAVINLLDNAIKYSEDGQTVTISLEETDGEAAIHVTDNGPGIPKKHIPRLFERFYRVDKSRSRKLGGTGLGLAIVKHVATAHRGRVGVETELDKGSTFSIYLPACANGNAAPSG